MVGVELTALERAVTAEIERRRDDLVALLADLVAYDTRAPDPDYAPRDEAALQDYVAGRMRAAGLAVRVWEPEAADLPPGRYPIPEGHDFRRRPRRRSLAAAQRQCRRRDGRAGRPLDEPAVRARRPLRQGLRTRRLRHEGRGGVHAARDRGAAHARGAAARRSDREHGDRRGVDR